VKIIEQEVLQLLFLMMMHDLNNKLQLLLLVQEVLKLLIGAKMQLFTSEIKEHNEINKDFTLAPKMCVVLVI